MLEQSESAITKSLTLLDHEQNSDWSVYILIIAKQKSVKEMAENN